jgi:tRNA-specific 2-thiouridylase
VLAVMGPEAVSRAVFPLGAFEDKESVRAEARARRLGVSTKPDSYDICFIADGDTRGFLERSLGEARARSSTPTAPCWAPTAAPSASPSASARAWAWTVPPPTAPPRYVLDVKPETRQVVVGAAELLSTTLLEASAPIPFEPLAPGREVSAQIRAHGEALPGIIERADDVLSVRLSSPVRASPPDRPSCSTTATA